MVEKLYEVTSFKNSCSCCSRKIFLIKFARFSLIISISSLIGAGATLCYLMLAFSHLCDEWMKCDASVRFYRWILFGKNHTGMFCRRVPINVCLTQMNDKRTAKQKIFSIDLLSSVLFSKFVSNTMQCKPLSTMGNYAFQEQDCLYDFD